MKDGKINDQLLANFDKANPGKNLFLLFKKESEIGKFVHVKKQENVIEYLFQTEDINKLIDNVPDAKAIIVHGLFIEFAEILLKIKQKKIIYWVIWGGDVYLMPKNVGNLYGKKTLQFNRKLRISTFVKKHDLLRAVYYKLKGKRDSFNVIEQAYEKIDTTVTYMQEDYQVLMKLYPKKYTFEKSAFLNIEQYVGEIFLNTRASGDNIIIGNSNTPESNHFDVMDYLKEYMPEGRKVYVPLSYGGGDEEYKLNVINTGKKLFHHDFVPLLDFMSLESYVRILTSCAVGVFYHFRQQAMGNIIAMIWLGARIYMSDRNPAYHYLKNLGLYVFDLTTDFPQFKLSSLSIEQQERNRDILMNQFNPVKVNEDLKRLINTIYNK